MYLLKALFTFLFLIFTCLDLHSQYADSIRIAFYNVENLFDIHDDPEKNDSDFLPGSDRYWTYSRYRKKLAHTSKVILAIGNWKGPALIGLCEVENRQVLNDLIFDTPLKKFQYNYIHFESPDQRGIDNALLYKKSAFNIIDRKPVRIRFPFDEGLKTRDILYVRGTFKNKDTLNLFVNHWPSRRGGQQKSEPKRIFVAEILRGQIDSILSVNPDAKIIVMGDFNDEPDNKSISRSLNTSQHSTASDSAILFNCMHQYQKKGFGSYKHRQYWNMLDQIMISYSLLNPENTAFTSPEKANIFQCEWITTVDESYPGTRPFKTYQGPKYLGGFSDHLPVYIDLYLKKNE